MGPGFPFLLLAPEVSVPVSVSLLICLLVSPTWGVEVCPVTSLLSQTEGELLPFLWLHETPRPRFQGATGRELGTTSGLFVGTLIPFPATALVRHPQDPLPLQSPGTCQARSCHYFDE